MKKYLIFSFLLCGALFLTGASIHDIQTMDGTQRAKLEAILDGKADVGTVGGASTNSSNIFTPGSTNTFTGPTTFSNITVHGPSALFTSGVALTNNGSTFLSNSTFQGPSVLMVAGVAFTNNGTSTLSNITLRSVTTILAGGVFTNFGSSTLSNLTVEGPIVYFGVGSTTTNWGSTVLSNLTVRGLATITNQNGTNSISPTYFKADSNNNFIAAFTDRIDVPIETLERTSNSGGGVRHKSMSGTSQYYISDGGFHVEAGAFFVDTAAGNFAQLLGSPNVIGSLSGDGLNTFYGTNDIVGFIRPASGTTLTNLGSIRITNNLIVAQKTTTDSASISQLATNLIVIGGGTNGTLATISIGTSNQVLTSNGAGVPPTFQTSAAATAQVYPNTDTIWFDQRSVVTGAGSMTFDQGSGNFQSNGRQDPDASNDTTRATIFLQTGTYHVVTLAKTESNSGKVTIYVNNTPIATNDMYSSSINLNVYNTNTYTVSTAGVQIVEYKLSSQNTNSSGFRFYFGKTIFNLTNMNQL